VIVSFIPGRVRLRLPELKDDTLAARVILQINAIPGITKAEIKTRTGSLLIEYDTAVISTEELVELGRAALEREIPGTCGL
jgi:copper chaperone CopZ